jgi:ectoine hydroxylase-related dioxygenase (phytanoyl-CoA dioxygenase family)
LVPFDDSTALLEDPERLRARAQRDGYLFFRGLLDGQSILDLRRAVMRVLDRYSLRRADAGPQGGKLDLQTLNRLPADELRLDIGVTKQIYVDLQRLPELHRLPHHPSLVAVYRRLFGEDVFVHPRHIMRAMTPHPANGTTPPHQDFPLIQGSKDTWTCWFPVGDCPAELGSLTVLRGSHRGGYLPVGNDFGDGNWTTWGAQLCNYETDWIGGDFALGDVLTFPCFTVHRSLPASVRDEIRVSMDVRYQRASDVIEARSLTNHSERPWEDIYAGWTEADTDLMYYWDRGRLALSPWDNSLMEPGTRRIC